MLDAGSAYAVYEAKPVGLEDELPEEEEARERRKSCLFLRAGMAMALEEDAGEGEEAEDAMVYMYGYMDLGV